MERSKRHTNESLEVSPVSDDLSHRMMRARRYNTKWSTNADKRALIINGDGLPSPLQYSDAGKNGSFLYFTVRYELILNHFRIHNIIIYMFGLY